MTGGKDEGVWHQVLTRTETTCRSLRCPFLVPRPSRSLSRPSRSFSRPRQSGKHSLQDDVPHPRPHRVSRRTLLWCPGTKQQQQPDDICSRRTGPLVEYVGTTTIR